VVREGPYQVDPWVIGIVEVEVEELAFDPQPHYSLEQEIDLDQGRAKVLDLELEMALVLVQAIDHVEQRVATLSASLLFEYVNLPRNMQSPVVKRSLTLSGDPRRSGEPHSPLHSAVLGYLGNL
jgi:hypothetical protein